MGDRETGRKGERGQGTYVGEERRDPPDDVQPTRDLHGDRRERAAHPAEQRVHDFEHGECLDDGRAPADSVKGRRGRREHGREVLLDPYQVRAALCGGVEQVRNDADEDVAPAEGGEEVVCNQVVLDDGGCPCRSFRAGQACGRRRGSQRAHLPALLPAAAACLGFPQSWPSCARVRCNNAQGGREYLLAREKPRLLRFAPARMPRSLCTRPGQHASSSQKMLYFCSKNRRITRETIT